MLEFTGGTTLQMIHGGNTKVRRLGYLRALSRLTAGRGAASDRVMSRLCVWGEEHRPQLLEYGQLRDAQGALSATTVDGARRYLDVASNLHFIHRQEGTTAQTQFGSLLSEIAELDSHNNPFYLGRPESIFLLYWLLLHDADLILLVSAAAADGSTLVQLQRQFQSAYLERLKSKFEVAQSDSSRSSLAEAVYRAENTWRNPMAYAEVVVPSRFNWLLDLGLIDDEHRKRNRTYLLNNRGRSLLSRIPVLGKSRIPDTSPNWLWENAVTAFSGPYFDSKKQPIRWDDVSFDTKIQVMRDTLPESMARFSLFGMRASSMLPALIMTAMDILSTHSIAVDFAALARFLNDQDIESALGYRLEFSTNHSTAYIYELN